MNSDNLLEILFALVYFLGSAVYDYLKKRKRLREMEAAPQPEPLEGDAAHPDDEPFEEYEEVHSPPEPPPVVEAPIPAPPVFASSSKAESLRPVLLMAIGDWERLASPVIGSGSASRVRAVLRGLLPGFEPGALWKDSDERVAALYLDALRELSEHLHEGTHGPSYLVGIGGAQVLNPLLEALHDDPSAPPDLILPVGWTLRGNVSTLAQLCGYWPLLVPPGEHHALGAFSVIQQGMLDILLGRLEVAQHFSREARHFLGNYLLDDEARDPEVVFALKRYGGVQLVVQGLAGAWLVRATGPLLHYGLSDSPGGLSSSVPPGLAYGLARLGEASNSTELNQGWMEFAARLDRFLDEITLADRPSSFGELSEAWSSEDSKEQEQLIQWTLKPKGPTTLKGRIAPLVALLSFLGIHFKTGETPQKDALEALKRAILRGISPTKQVSKVPQEFPVGTVVRDRFSARDAFLLQVILGPPRAQVPLGRKALRQPSKTGPVRRARI